MNSTRVFYVTKWEHFLPHFFIFIFYTFCPSRQDRNGFEEPHTTTKMISSVNPHQRRFTFHERTNFMQSSIRQQIKFVSNKKRPTLKTAGKKMNEAENGEAANDKKECIALKNIPGHGEDEAKTDEAQEAGNKV